MSIFDLIKKLTSRQRAENDADNLPILDSLERDAQKSDISWVQYFNVKLGLDLGGIMGVMEAFSDPATLMEHFSMLVENDMASSRRGISASERQSGLRRSLSHVGKNEQDLLLKYWDFFGDACARIHTNTDFVKWIYTPKNFTAMPDIFTFEVLKLACRITGR